MGVNYGAEKIRFPAPVPVGSRVRASATLDEATPFEGGVQMNLGVTIEIEGQAKPAMVALDPVPPLRLSGVAGCAETATRRLHRRSIRPGRCSRPS